MNQTATQNRLAALMQELGVRGRGAATMLRNLSADQRKRALEKIAAAISDHKDKILTANKLDMEAGRSGGKLSTAFLDRLALDEMRVAAMQDAVLAIAEQQDPVGERIDNWQMPNGLQIERVRCPIGVIGMIYESRPNVTSDAAALCLRSGNAVILRSGSDALHSAGEITTAIHMGLSQAGLPEHAVQLVPMPDRECVGHMLTGLGGNLDLLVPRGGHGLVARVLSEARVAVLGHLEGLCHSYVDQSADRQKAVDIVVNAKMRRPGICGASETLLIDQSAASDLVPLLAQALIDAGCALRGDSESCNFHSAIVPAEEQDWRTEYLAPIISVKLVDGVRGAIDHITRYGSGHTEAIICEDRGVAERFLREVDAGIVMHNASTQFADGGELGLGAEMGIATGRLHARGPVGARELTIAKFLVRGEHHIRP